MPESVVETATMASADRLRRELKKVVPEILDGGGGTVEAIDNAIRILVNLRKIQSKAESDVSCSTASSASRSPYPAVPKEFICPLSEKIMSDPVIIATGQTYERAYIQKLLREHSRICPTSREVISHSVLTPNHLIRNLISQWCQDHQIQLPKPVSDPDEAVPEFHNDLLESLLQKISSVSVSDQREAAKELRRLTKRVPSFRIFFLSKHPDSISQLLSPLSSSANAVNHHPELHEDLIATLFNVSIPEKNKTLVAENPVVVSLLVKSLSQGTIEARRNAAATLFSLSAIDSNKRIIGNSNSLRPLVDLIEEGDLLAMQDAGSAVFNLCTLTENKERAIQAGAVRVLTEKIKNGVFMDASLSILALLSTHNLPMDEMSGLGFMSDLFSNVIRKKNCPRMKENAIAIIFNMCDRDRSRLRMVCKEETLHCTLTKLAAQGTERAKRKAKALLQKLKRIGAYNPHTT